MIGVIEGVTWNSANCSLRYASGNSRFLLWARSGAAFAMGHGGLGVQEVVGSHECEGICLITDYLNPKP